MLPNAGPYTISAPKGLPVDVDVTIKWVIYATGLIPRVYFFVPNVDNT